MRNLKYLFAALLLMPLQAGAIEVVTTIKPLQLIAAAIMDGTGEPTLLLPAQSSPHDYQLRPSDINRLQRADIVFQVGPALERFLSKPLAGLRAETRVITLQRLFETDDTASTRKADEEAADHEDHEDHESAAHDSHEHGRVNPHFWLSPVKALAIATAMSDSMSQINQADAGRYSRNLENFRTRLHKLDDELRTQLLSVENQGYFVFHDAYEYFEQHYGLRHLGAFTISPERRPGARHLSEIRHQLEDSSARCVFAEPQFRPAIIRVITDGIDVRQGELDPLATATDANPDGYLQFLRQLADSFHSCLASETDR